MEEEIIKPYCECKTSHLSCSESIDTCRCVYCGKPTFWLWEKWQTEDKRKEEMAKESGEYYNP